MSGEERRNAIIDLIRNSKKAVSGAELSSHFHVSRQIIVSDIALLRAADYEIISTNRGYIINNPYPFSCIIKVKHSDSQIEEELTTIIDLGGTIVDVFVNHKVYGRIKADLNIRSRRNIHEFLADIKNGKSTPLKNITSDYHYHTITADSNETIELIKTELLKKGFLILPK